MFNYCIWGRKGFKKSQLWSYCYCCFLSVHKRFWIANLNFVNSMHSQRAKVTLSGPPQLTATDDWPQIWSGLSAQFPLRNLHWKPASRTSIRTIQGLDINLLALESVKDESASQIPTSLLDRPLINVYVLICEVCSVLLVLTLYHLC